VAADEVSMILYYAIASQEVYRFGWKEAEMRLSDRRFNLCRH
jgi:hypothetical protein